MRRQGGYTLVELAITVSIVGILAVIGIPTFVNMMPKYRLGNAVDSLANEIAMARATAISKSADGEVVFDPAGDAYALRRTVGGPNYARATVGSYADLLAVTYLDGTPAPNTLQVNATGTMEIPVLKQAILVTLATPDGSLRKRVVVWGTGRIKIERLGASGWTAD